MSLPEPDGFQYYGDYTAHLAGTLVEEHPAIDVLLDVLADKCESEYGLTDEDRSNLSRALANGTPLAEYVKEVDADDWVLDNTYSDIERADMALYSDVITEMREFVAQRYCENRNA